MNLVSDQVSKQEIQILVSELAEVMKLEIGGDLVEMGCYQGTSALFISKHLKNTQSEKQFHVYDSFAGLPDKTDKDLSPAGEQFKTGELLATKAQLIKNYKQANLPLPVIHKGWFKDLSPSELPDRICFAFLDGDYYESILTSLRLVWPNLTPGAVVIVDDYVSDALPGAQKAVDEWLNGHKAKIHTEASLAIIKL